MKNKIEQLKEEVENIGKAVGLTPEQEYYTMWKDEKKDHRHTKKMKNLIITMLAILLIASNYAWFWYLSGFTVVEPSEIVTTTTETTVTQDAADGGNAVYGDKNTVNSNGEADSKANSNKNNN